MVVSINDKLGTDFFVSGPCWVTSRGGRSTYVDVEEVIPDLGSKPSPEGRLKRVR